MSSAASPSLRSDTRTSAASGAALLRHAANRLVEAGLDPTPLLLQAQIPPSLLEGKKAGVGANGQIVFLNLAAAALSDDLLGFHLAQTFDFRALGLRHYVMASAGTLREALAHEETYRAILEDAIRVRAGKTDGVSVELIYQGIARHLDRHQAEFWLTATLRQCRLLTSRDLIPSSATLVHMRTGRVPEMDRYFGREVVFGAARDLLEFERDAGDLQIVTYDPYLNQILTTFGERVATEQLAREADPLRVRVENAITPRLRHGTAKIDAVANDLGTSARTLARSLARSGTSFSAVLDEVRFRLATQYLQEGTPTISQVAWLLGYREPSTSVRAFKRWTGQTPTEFRRQLQRGGLGRPL